ncbi:helix-turn-helix domain-containing protein [Paenibacillus methanolicus]|uniref:helix-turn-helix domain-containing protein n=1 Tax=Paenibacillus methanolicus TaxID=582686 RepID=UPI0011E60E26|nr:helix-turn-helix domain-containing protein [Paenibacillus methanolicus]
MGENEAAAFNVQAPSELEEACVPAPVHQSQWLSPVEMLYRNDAPMAGAQFHSHPYYEIYYFQGGECNYLIGDKLIALKPGDLILMHGMTLHCSNPSPHQPYVRSILHFEPAMIGKLLRPEAAAHMLQPFEELRNIRLSLSAAQQDEYEALLAQLHVLYRARKTEGAGAGADRFTFRFLDVLALIREWCDGPTGQHEHDSLKERHVQSVVSYIEENYARELTLDMIAGALHLTKPYLSHLFKEVTGTTVFKYLYNRRLNQAKMLFRLEPHRSVSDVCRTVGFRHLAHFSRLFKAAEGQSPEQYRKGMAMRGGLSASREA